MTKDILKYLIGLYLDKTFGEDLKTTVREKEGFYYIGLRVRKEQVLKLFGKLTRVVDSVFLFKGRGV